MTWNLIFVKEFYIFAAVFFILNTLLGVFDTLEELSLCCANYACYVIIFGYLYIYIQTHTHTCMWLVGCYVACFKELFFSLGKVLVVLPYQYLALPPYFHMYSYRLILFITDYVYYIVISLLLGDI
jgi:hypothetical protein